MSTRANVARASRAPRLAVLAVLGLGWLAGSAMGCPGEAESVDAGTRPTAPTVSDEDLIEEFLAIPQSDRGLLENWAAVFEAINSTLDRISDAESARAEQPRLSQIVDGPLARLRVLRERGDFRPDTGEAAATWLRQHNRFVGNLMRLNAHPAVHPVLEGDLERLMSFFEPID